MRSVASSGLLSVTIGLSVTSILLIRLAFWSYVQEMPPIAILFVVLSPVGLAAFIWWKSTKL